jgi:hypothetical protein
MLQAATNQTAFSWAWQVGIEMMCTEPAEKHANSSLHVHATHIHCCSHYSVRSLYQACPRQHKQPVFWWPLL